MKNYVKYKINKSKIYNLKISSLQNVKFMIMLIIIIKFYRSLKIHMCL